MIWNQRNNCNNMHGATIKKILLIVFAEDVCYVPAMICQKNPSIQTEINAKTLSTALKTY